MESSRDECLAAALHLEQRQEDLTPILDGPVHAIDLQRLGVVIDLDGAVAVPAAEQISRGDTSSASLLFGAVGHADGATAFRFWSQDRHATLKGYGYGFHGTW